jgi:glycosyltransferase involved in cell wall biosynthesis
MRIQAKPEVSYIMTTYNNDKTIKESLNSINVFNPDLSFEIVVVNDGSTDQTLEILENFEFVVPFQIINLEKNIGRPRAANLAISKSEGQYIAILDADDLEIGERLSQSTNFLNVNKDIDLVAGQYYRFGEWGFDTEISSLPTNHEEISRMLAKFRNPIAHSSCMYRKSWVEKIGGYNPDFSRCQDLDLFLRGFNGRNFHVFSDAFMMYRVDRRFIGYSYYMNEEIWRKYVINSHTKKSNSHISLNRSQRRKMRLFLTLKYFLLACFFILKQPLIKMRNFFNER